jgi:hypothetical protein
MRTAQHARALQQPPLPPPSLHQQQSTLTPRQQQHHQQQTQMNRTIQNYQKAYRKKVEGLKTELHSTRADNAQLRGQVRRLRRAQYASIPSLAIGVAAGVLGADRIRAGLRALKKRLDELRSGSGSGKKAAAAGDDGDSDAYEQPAAAAAPQGADA